MEEDIFELKDGIYVNGANCFRFKFIEYNIHCCFKFCFFYSDICAEFFVRTHVLKKFIIRF